MAWDDLLNSLAPHLPTAYADQEDRLRGENPALYWYPCCRIDLSPLVFDVRALDGLRIFPLTGSQGSVVLWMNDWDPALPSLYEALTRDVQITLRRTLETCGASLDIVWDSRFSTSIRVQPELRGDPSTIPLELFRVKVYNPRASRAVRRPQTGDDYTILYSNVCSTVLNRLVFKHFQLALKIGAVIHPGWCEPPNGPINHYSLVPTALVESHARTGVRPYLLTDDRREISLARLFSWTGLSAEDWTGVPVRLLKFDHRGANNMLIANPTESQWQELYENCLAVPEDIEHLNRFPYGNARVRDGGQLILWLRRSRHHWLIQEDGQIVGFMNYGEVIPGHRNSFGLVIGRRFARRGYGCRALAEFLRRREEFDIGDINGYCHRENVAMLRMMEAAGFQRDETYRDCCDENAIRYCLTGNEAA